MLTRRDNGRSRPIRLALLLSAVAALAVPVVLSGLDRATGARPALAARIPSAFAAQSLLVRGRAELTGQRYAEAEQTAGAAIRAAPIDPESAAMLGAARLGRGDGAGAQRAFLVAGQFGWRTPTTQLYWMEQALALSDYPVAALRLDAMLRQQPQMAGNSDLLAPLESVPDGREALAARLAGRPVWLDVYAGSSFGLSLGEATARAAVMDALARRGTRLGCAGIGQLVGRLVDLGAAARAHSTWLAHCPVSRDGLLADASFGSLRMHQATTPFDWVIIGDSDVSVSLEQGPAGRNHLLVASSAAFPRKIMMQLALVPPGRYQLSWRAADSLGQPTARITASFACNADAREALPASLDSASKTWSAPADVDGACAARWLSFSIQPGSDGVTLGDIGLRRLP